MKKILAIVLAALMLVAFVGCGNTIEETEAPETEAPETNAPETEAPETEAPEASESDANPALDIVNNIINSFTDAEKEDIYLSVAGGYGENLNWDAPGSHPINDEESRASAIAFFNISEEILDMIDGEIGMAMNPMRIQNLMFGCFRVADTVNVTECAELVKTTVLGSRWTCGFPEKYVLIIVDDYILTLYGASIQLDAIAAKTQTLYPSAVVFADELI